MKGFPLNHKWLTNSSFLCEPISMCYATRQHVLRHINIYQTLEITYNVYGDMEYILFCNGNIGYLYQ